MSTTKDTERSEQQAWSQVEGIVEMVANLTREGAAAAWVADKDREECLAIIREHDEDEAEEFAGITEDSVLDSMRERIVELLEKEWIEPNGWEWDEDDARQTISDDPLSVEYRSGWVTPGSDMQPEEFKILLCTGGPAVQIRGEIGQHGEPETAWVEHQEWGTPWTELFGLSEEQQEAILTYCRQFIML